MAAAPSTTLFSNSTKRRIASAICSSRNGHDSQIDKRARDLKCVRPDLWNSEAIRKRGMHRNFRRFARFKRC